MEAPFGVPATERTAYEVRSWFRKSWKIRKAAEVSGTTVRDQANNAYVELLSDAIKEGIPWSVLAMDETKLERIADRVKKRCQRSYYRDKQLHSCIKELGDTIRIWVDPDFGLDTRDAIEQIVRELNFDAVERAILRCYLVFTQPKSSEVAEELGMTVEHVRRVKKRVFRKLKRPRNFAIFKKMLGID